MDAVLHPRDGCSPVFSINIFHKLDMTWDDCFILYIIIGKFI